MDEQSYNHSQRMKEYWKAKKLLTSIPRSDKGKTHKEYTQHIKARFRSYINRANARGLEFNLTEDEFEHLLNEPCFYCRQKATGIDRKNNNRGYTIRNSVACCGQCNWMKGMLSHDDFIEQCQLVAAVQQSTYW